MRFDMMHVLENRGRQRPWGVLLDEARRVAELGDELGFDGLWMGEHHFDAEGADQLPNPILLSADLAARTSNIRLGMAAVTLTLWHPIRLAEDLAMLDHFSDGRIDVAFSRGILRGEIVNLVPEADRLNEEKSRAIFSENLEIVKKAWREDPFRWQGDRYQIPWHDVKWPGKAYSSYHGEDGYLKGLAVIPQPLQPMIPLYAVSQAEEGWRQAAQQGLGTMSSHPVGQKLRNLNAAYQDEAQKVGGVPSHVTKVAPAVREFCVAETDEEARRESEEYVNDRFELIARVRGLGAWLDLGEDPEDPKLKSQTGFDIMMERDQLYIGSPESVAERLIRLHQDEGFEHFIMSPGRGTQEQLQRSMRLMATEVIPRVRQATGKTVDVAVDGQAAR